MSPAVGDPGPAAVSLSHVAKTFRLPHERYHTLRERALHPFQTRTIDVLRALDDVSLKIGAGEFFGIVGRNGSGKSTLLKCLAGIYAVDSGSIEISGRLSPFIELGVGFNPDLTARDNLIINAIMLGLSRAQALERFDAIVAFAELEEFMDLKLKNYSSGMHVRLAFAVAIQVDAEIVLIDEVLAVGDASFQQKCFDEFQRLRSEGRTIVFVTHDMGAVERFCDRAMLIEHGHVVDIGDPASIARQYNDLNFRRRSEGSRAEDRSDLPLQRGIEVVDAWFEGPGGERLAAMSQGEPCCARIDVHFGDRAQKLTLSISLLNDLGNVSFATTKLPEPGPSGDFAAGDVATVRVRFENWLAPGRYRLCAWASAEGVEAEGHDLGDGVSSIVVHSGQPGGGLADLPHSFEIERV